MGSIPPRPPAAGSWDPSPPPFPSPISIFTPLPQLRAEDLGIPRRRPASPTTQDHHLFSRLIFPPPPPYPPLPTPRLQPSITHPIHLSPSERHTVFVPAGSPAVVLNRVGEPPPMFFGTRFLPSVFSSAEHTAPDRLPEELALPSPPEMGLWNTPTTSRRRSRTGILPRFVSSVPSPFHIPSSPHADPLERAICREVCSNPLNTGRRTIVHKTTALRAVKETGFPPEDGRGRGIPGRLLGVGSLSGELIHSLYHPPPAPPPRHSLTIPP